MKRDLLFQQLSAEQRSAFSDQEARWLSYMTVHTQKEAELRGIKQRRAEIEIDVLGPEAAANWKEEEADEVGYEIHLRAGFVSDAYADLFKKLETYKNKGEQPDYSGTIERGTKDHPSNMWRLHNITKVESLLHSEEYRTLPGSINGKRNIFGDELEKLRKAYGYL